MEVVMNRLHSSFHQNFSRDIALIVARIDRLSSDSHNSVVLRQSLRQVRSDILALEVRVRDEMYFHQPPTTTLTEAELRVLERTIKGELTREISRHLHISEATVKTHLSAIYRKLEVRNRAEAIRKALIEGLTG